MHPGIIPSILRSAVEQSSQITLFIYHELNCRINSRVVHKENYQFSCSFCSQKLSSYSKSTIRYCHIGTLYLVSSSFTLTTNHPNFFKAELLQTAQKNTWLHWWQFTYTDHVWSFAFLLTAVKMNAIHVIWTKAEWHAYLSPIYQAILFYGDSTV